MSNDGVARTSTRSRRSSSRPAGTPAPAPPAYDPPSSSRPVAARWAQSGGRGRLAPAPAPNADCSALVAIGRGRAGVRPSVGGWRLNVAACHYAALGLVCAPGPGAVAAGAAHAWRGHSLAGSRRPHTDDPQELQPAQAAPCRGASAGRPGVGVLARLAGGAARLLGLGPIAGRGAAPGSHMRALGPRGAHDSWAGGLSAHLGGGLRRRRCVVAGAMHPEGAWRSLAGALATPVGRVSGAFVQMAMGAKASATCAQAVARPRTQRARSWR